MDAGDKCDSGADRYTVMGDDILADKLVIAGRIKSARETAAMTQMEVELELPYAHGDYYRLEGGQRYPSLRTAAKLARFFNMTIDDLVLR